MKNRELFKMWLWELRESGEVGLEENLAKEFRDYLDKIAEEWLNAQLKQMGNSFSQTQPTFKPATNYPNRYIANKDCPECGNNAYKHCPPYPTQTTEYYECMGCGHVVMVSPNSSH